MSDEDIREVFENLKRMDENLSPAFEIPSASDLPRWQWRPVVIAAAAGSAAAFVALSFLINPPSTDSSSPASPVAVTASPFDERAQAISRELFTASDMSWGSRTDFLLDFDTILTDIK